MESDLVSTAIVVSSNTAAALRPLSNLPKLPAMRRSRGRLTFCLGSSSDTTYLSTALYVAAVEPCQVADRAAPGLACRFLIRDVACDITPVYRYDPIRPCLFPKNWPAASTTETQPRRSYYLRPFATRDDEFPLLVQQTDRHRVLRGVAPRQCLSLAMPLILPTIVFNIFDQRRVVDAYRAQP